MSGNATKDTHQLWFCCVWLCRLKNKEELNIKLVQNNDISGEESGKPGANLNVGHAAELFQQFVSNPGTLLLYEQTRQAIVLQT